MNLERTRRAVAGYDAALAKLCRADLSDAELQRAYLDWQFWLTEVGLAFASDTADRNHLDVAGLVRPGPWLRSLLERYP